MNQICVLDDLCVLLIEKALEREFSPHCCHLFFTSLSVLGVAHPMKGHPEDVFAKRGGSLKEESVCSSLFFLFLCPSA